MVKTPYSFGHSLRSNKEYHMALSLQKGGNLSLSKTAPNLTNIVIGLGWDARQPMAQHLTLDASLFMVAIQVKFVRC
jgi:stress response protein SCP2